MFRNRPTPAQPQAADIACGRSAASPQRASIGHGGAAR